MTTAPRVPPLAREDWTDEAREVFAYWEGEEARENGSRSNTMMTLANHPRLALASLDFGKYFMLHSALTGRQQKMVVLRVAHRYNSPYQWAHNSLGARQLGMTNAEIEAIKEGPGAAGWSREDRVLLSVIDQTCDGGRISEETWAEAASVMDTHQLMDLIQATGYFSMVAWSLIAMGVQLEPDFAAFSTNRAKAD
jgi:alkylhydroperoxidase family enzyme